MGKTKRKFSKEQKMDILRTIEAGKSVVQTAKEFDIHPSMIHQWKRTYLQYGELAFQGNGHTYTHEAHNAELERKVGQMTMEIAFLKKLLAKLEERERSVRKKGGI